MNNDIIVAEQNSLERLIGRDKTVTSFMLVLMTALAAAYTIFGVGMPMSALDMTISISGSTSQMPMMMKPMWTFNYTILVFLMWWIMMVAMMLPSAAPTILLYTALIRKANKAENIKKMIMVFTLGYLITWAFFSLLATLLQSGLEAKEWMSPMMMTLTNDILIAITLIIAGFYQLTPIKYACLEKCRNPASFLAENRNMGGNVALKMGLKHGVYCLGCCWFLMGLLFVGGIMNLYWILGLTIFVALEKLAPKGQTIAKVAGLLAGMMGVYQLAITIST